LDIQDLTMSTVDGAELIDRLTLVASRGDIVGVRGPSGSGKTTLLRTIAGAPPPGDHDGRVSVQGKDILALNGTQLREFRRHRLGFVGQDPAARLNPRMRVGSLLSENAGTAQLDAGRLLTDVGLSPDLLRRKPRQLSGGQQRRVALARALAKRPDILLLDEPTVGLDEALRHQLCELLRRLADEGTTIVFASHDLPVLDRLADGVVELGTRVNPVAQLPRRAATEPDGDEILRVDALSAWVGPRRRGQILHDVDLRLNAHDAVAVLGVSGAGKTTLARAITGLHNNIDGEIRLAGRPLAANVHRRKPQQRRRVQLIPQDPLGTVNPSRSIGATLRRPLRLHRRVSRRQLPAAVAELLTSVGLGEDFAGRYPHELSGGQRQRVAIARAVAADPDVLVCDEITSALDVATATDIMAVLSDLRVRRGLALIMITHELPFALRHTSSALVISEGRLVDSGPTDEVVANLRGAPGSADLEVAP
jgi:peptide/nickel transport system ATP-binding protein